MPRHTMNLKNETNSGTPKQPWIHISNAVTTICIDAKNIEKIYLIGRIERLSIFFCRRLEQNTYIRRKKKSFNFQTNSIQYEDQWYENVLRKKYLDERLVFSALAYMRQGNVCCVLASYIISRTKIIGIVVFWKRSSSLFFNGASISFLFKLNLIFISSLSRFFFSFYFTLILVVEH